MDITNQIQAILNRAGKYIHGKDSDDDNITYESIAEWKEETGLVAKSEVDEETATTTKQQWYKTGYDYYENKTTCPATVDGVLGGFSNLSKRDIEGSTKFIQYLTTTIRPQLKLTKEENDGQSTHACECGAGIGRVSKGLLLPIGISQCDLIEPSPRLLKAAPEYLGDEYSARCQYFCKGLQDFEPNEDYYDIIWIQWVVIYLTDEDFISFLKRCAKSLTKSGVIVIKDNTCEDQAFIVDQSDSSVTRSHSYLLAIAELSGLRVVYQSVQEDFPNSIFPVPIIALEPKL